MNDSESWAHDSRCYEQLVVFMTWKTWGFEHRALDYRNTTGLWITWTTLNHELRALDAMNRSRLCLAWKTLRCELMALWSLTRSTDSATRYSKGERESWFSSFEKFVPVRNGFVWSHHLLFIFILNGQNLSKNKNPSMTLVKKKQSMKTRF